MSLPISEPIPPEPDRNPEPEPTAGSEPPPDPDLFPASRPDSQPELPIDPVPDDEPSPESVSPGEVPLPAEDGPEPVSFPESEPELNSDPEPVTEPDPTSTPEPGAEPDLAETAAFTLPPTPVLETPPPPPPSLRRRRYRRRFVPWELDQRAAFFRELVHQATPSVDFFLFSVIAGVAAGAALLLDSPALFFLAALLSPFMAPVLGLALSSATGRMGFFIRSLFVLAIGSGLVFGLGIIAGWIGQNIPGLVFTQVVFHTTFSWPDLLVVIMGAALTAYLAVRSPKQRPLVSSVALAYELYLPLAASGFGWVWSMPGVFPEGLILFAINLALAAVTAAFILLLLGVHPLPSGSAWVVSVLLLLVLVGAALFGIGTAVMPQAFANPLAIFASASPTPTLTNTPSPLPSDTPLPPATQTPLPPVPTITPTNTLVSTATPTITTTPSPTPVYGLVDAGELNGIIIRPEPGSLEIVTTLLNGNLVEILPEVVNKNGFLWMHIRAPDGQEGWVQNGLIVTATPRPG